MEDKEQTDRQTKICPQHKQAANVSDKASLLSFDATNFLTN